MSTLTSASTIDDVRAAYLDSASYEEDGDLEKAATFVTACRMLLLLIPKSATKSGESYEIDPAQIKAELIEARRWISERATDSHVDYLDLSAIRD